MRLFYPWVRFPVERQNIWPKKQRNTKKSAIQCVFVLEDLPFPILKKTKEVSVLFLLEPSGIKKKYKQSFLDQFDVIISWRKDIKHSLIYRGWVPFPLFYRCHFKDGKVSKSDPLQKIAATTGIQKSKICSFLVSKKTITQIHKIRVDLANYLQSQMPVIDQFGKNQFLADKCNALDPYEYTIVIENQDDPDGFTEKIQDAFLAECLPFYWGCSNLEKYFPKKSFVRIPLVNKKKTLLIIKKTFRNNARKQFLRQIMAAKKKVLFKYNIYSACRMWENKLTQKKNIRKICVTKTKMLIPEYYFEKNLFLCILQSIKNLLYWVCRSLKYSY